MMGFWIWLVTAPVAAPLTATGAVTLSLERSVDVVSAHAAIETARGEAKATALFQSDPTVQARWSAVGDLHGVSIMQPVSVTGEGLSAHRSALAEVERASAAETRARLEVAAATRLAWVSAVEARQQVLLAEQALVLATRLREGAEAEEEMGDGSLLNARLARLQQTEARSTWMVAVTAEGSRLAELTAWTGTTLAELELPNDPLEGMPRVELHASTRSDIEAAHQAAEAARARLAGERAGTIPPLRVGAFYEKEGQEVRAGPSLGVTVPLWHRNADGRARAASELHVAEAVVAERERVAQAEQQATARVLASLEGAGDTADPREEARAALESVAAGYEGGELDLLTASLLRQQILAGQRAWLQGRRVRAEAHIYAALAHENTSLLGE